MEPSWAILDAAMGRGPARPDAGRGGEVNLPSRESKEVGKGNTLDHPSPEGWWDYVCKITMNAVTTLVPPTATERRYEIE